MPTPDNLPVIQFRCTADMKLRITARVKRRNERAAKPITVSDYARESVSSMVEIEELKDTVRAGRMLASHTPERLSQHELAENRRARRNALANAAPKAGRTIRKGAK